MWSETNESGTTSTSRVPFARQVVDHLVRARAVHFTGPVRDW